MFHIFLYYCIKINKCIEAEGLDKLYLNKLSNLYVAKDFKIDIGRFALLCSKCVEIKLRKCIHMIYYLIYGRLATNSYVNNIASQLNFVNNRKKDKLKTIISTKFVSKRGNYTISEKKVDINESVMTECDKLAEDLKLILHSNKNN